MYFESDPKFAKITNFHPKMSILISKPKLRNSIIRKNNEKLPKNMVLKSSILKIFELKINVNGKRSFLAKITQTINEISNKKHSEKSSYVKIIIGKNIGFFEFSLKYWFQALLIFFFVAKSLFSNL